LEFFSFLLSLVTICVHKYECLLHLSSSLQSKTKVLTLITLLTLWQRLAYVISFFDDRSDVPAESMSACFDGQPCPSFRLFPSCSLISSPLSASISLAPSQTTAPERCSHHLKPCQGRETSSLAECQLVALPNLGHATFLNPHPWIGRLCLIPVAHPFRIFLSFFSLALHTPLTPHPAPFFFILMRLTNYSYGYCDPRLIPQLSPPGQYDVFFFSWIP